MKKDAIQATVFAVHPGRRQLLKTMGGTALSILAPGALLSACGGDSDELTPIPAGYRVLTADVSQRATAIRSLQGVDGPPVPATVGASNVPAGSTIASNIDNANGLDRTAQFQQLGVDFVRTHDLDAFGTGDIDGLGVRPTPRWRRATTSPRSTRSSPASSPRAPMSSSGSAAAT